MSATTNAPKPKLACEIAADRVLAGRYSDNGSGLEAAAARELAPGRLLPDLVENNLRQRDAGRAGLAGGLGRVVRRSQRGVVVVLEGAVHVVLADLETQG